MRDNPSPPPSPGLLVDIVSVLKDINVNVVSAEIDTIGDRAQVGGARE